MKFAITTSLLAENKPIEEEERLMIKVLDRKGIESCLINPVSCETILGKDSVKVYYEGSLVSDADVLIVRRTRNAERQVYELAKSMESAGVICVDAADSLVYPTAKLVPQLYRLGNVKFPRSAFLQRADENSFRIAETIGLKLPFIVKPQESTKGEGVALIQDLCSMIDYAEKYPETPIIIQERIDIAREYRVITVGTESLGACLKRSDGIAKNVGQGAEFQFLRDETIEALALKAVSYQPGDIFGVDVAQSKDGELYILECNRNPRFPEFRRASGIPVEEFIIDYCISKISK